MSGYKINCPHHVDHTASCHVYEDGRYYCFGCGAKGLTDKLSVTVPTSSKPHSIKESLPESLSYINSLPKKLIRGLVLPFDSISYYIVFPTNDFYLKRYFNPPKSGSKYLGPKGHPKPLYKAFTGDLRGVLLLIEGQLNAASCPIGDGYSIVSPGSATDFNRKHTVEYCLQYDRICLIVDKDAAGVAAGIQLQQTLRNSGKQCFIYAMDRDLNEILCEQGHEAVAKEIRKALELFGVPTR